jgi:tryptophanyl-tRNA synthetase
MTASKRIFSGVQPTGNLHLGNYLGAIRNWARPQDPATLRASTREVTASLIASGIDPKGSIVFNQSQVTAHAELAWIFNCVAKIGWLNRMTQFKDKAGKNRENASAGLYIYPVLMAADILAYKATHVPVGEDQKQHLELTRDIAGSFNDTYGVEFFPLTEPLIFGEATRVMNLRDGTKKMSKSDESDYTRINLTDDTDLIAQKIRKARTDPMPLPGSARELTERPEANNLIGIYAALADVSRDAVCAEFDGAQFSGFKNALADLAIAKLSPITAEMRRLLDDPAYIDGVLRDGADRAQAMAAPILRDVQDIVGFLRP